MTDFVYSGGVRFDDEAVADVTMDKDGHPLTCKNPITGEELGGGGLSDFSTAEVTITNKTTNPVPEVNMAYIEDDNIKTIPNPLIPNTPAVFKAILYKNSAEITVTEYSFGDLSGAVEYSDNGVIITGDCSFSIIVG